MATCVAVLVSGCQPAVPAPVSVVRQASAADSLYDPPRDLGVLFHDIQLARVYPDLKTLVDAKPKLAPADIVVRYTAAKVSGPVDLKAFVEQNFEAPRPAGEGVRTDTTQTMEEHIRALWPSLTRA